MTLFNKFSIKQKLIFNVFVAVGALALLMIVMVSEISNFKQLAKIEAGIYQLESGVLQLRRNEKDFLARKDLKYLDKFDKNVKKLIAANQILQQNFNDFDIDSSALKEFARVSKDYQARFHSLVSIQQKIGLHPKDGLYGKLRSAVHAAESILKQHENYHLLAEMLQLRRAEKDFMLRLDLKYLAKFDKGIDSFHNVLESEVSYAQYQSDLLNKINSYQTTFKELVQAQQQLGLDSKSGELGELRSTIHQTDKSLKKLLTFTNEKIEAIQTSLVIQTIVMFVIITSILVSYIWVTTSSIVKPINIVSNAIHKVRAENDLTVVVNYQANDELAKLTEDFNSLMEDFRVAIGHIHSTTGVLDQAMGDLDRNTQATSDGMVNQQQESEMVATAATEMQSTIEEIARNTEAAANKAEHTNEVATQGSLQVSKTVSDINSLSNRLNEAAKVVDALEKDSETIGSVLGVIRGIAEQTNLLALNAAIEAARAGEQGRGFAVVADEVRNLAMRTQESTQEIESIISSLQSRTSEIVDVMDICQTEGTQSAEQAAIAGGQLDEITENITAIVEMNTMIAAAIEEQSAVATEVNKNVVNIRDIALEVSEMTDMNAQTSGEISQQVSELHSAVDRFQV